MSYEQRKLHTIKHYRTGNSAVCGHISPWATLTSDKSKVSCRACKDVLDEQIITQSA